MTSARYAIRPMTRSDLDVAIAWAAAEGWNPGLDDADSFYAADPTGFWMGWLGDQPIASLSTVKYGDRFGFVGFYIVVPQYRGQGYGWAIWQAGLASLGDRLIGLDGVVAQQDNYQRSGFQLAYRNQRYSGPSNTLESALPAAIRPVEPTDFPALLTYDRQLFPEDHRLFLEKWLTQPRAIALGYFTPQGLQGYGQIRPSHTGYRIGPLFADHPEIAEQLFAALQSRIPIGQSIFWDIPTVNTAAIAIATAQGFTPMFDTARMYRGTAPAVSLDRLYGVTSLELG
ncbi:GNAT family N-acetyltransferase [Synechococcus elongatus IITB4]|uniref:GNAT family N-acetyltransferase n=1 Tax=Synechococcus elongatus TaxID=32046 RepID=UPI0030CF5D4B